MLAWRLCPSYLCNHMEKCMQAIIPHIKARHVPFHTMYGSLICSKGYRVMDQNVEDSWLRAARPQCARQKAKQSWKRECLSLSACHIAVCWSWGSNYTSFKRGHSGQSTDIKIGSIVQLIGIIQMCFGVWLLSTHTLQNVGLSLCSHWEQVRPPYRNWKGTSIAFIWGIKASSTKRGCRATKFINLLSNLPSYSKWFSRRNK